MKRKICVVTTSRADYGSLACLLSEIKKDKSLDLQTVVGGMHLLASQGMTYKIIEKDGFKISAKVPLLSENDSESQRIKDIGQGCGLFCETFLKLNPTIVVLFGDRFEILPAAIAAMMLKIPIAHLSGGELTEGAIDDSIRHSVTKMSNLHFPAAEEYRRRIIQLGEQPKYVFNFGHIALDNLKKLNLLNRLELSRQLNFDLNKSTALVTFHPATLEKISTENQVENLLKALKDSRLNVVFTKANADSGGTKINALIAKFCDRNLQQYRLFDNLGQRLYYSCLKNLDIVVGNSSSGLYEAPSFKVAVVNIGDRQRGRLKAGNVVDAQYSPQSISQAIQRGMSKDFKEKLKSVRNPYMKSTNGLVAQKIVSVLKKVPLTENLLKKSFYDLKP